MNPYLSIVIAARNDNHGDHFMQRLRLCLQNIYALVEKYRLPTEVLIIEWNPPSDTPPLRSVLPLPFEKSTLQIRILQVPSTLHRKYSTHKLLGMYQMTAKNVGIRRAKGEFVLCTNADIIFSEQVFAFLAEQRLQSACFYRCNRCDVPLPPISISASAYDLSAVQAFCRKNIQQRLGKNRWYANFPGSSPFWYRYLPMQLLTILLSRLLWLLIKPVYNRYHSLDTWACGDFTLMHRSDWLDIKGYAECDAYSLHIDSLALGAAAALKKRQIILPLSHCVYHISHEDGWEITDPMKKMQFDLRVPKLDGSTLQQLLLQMIQTGQIPDFNDKDWGHATHSFQEFLLERKSNKQSSASQEETLLNSTDCNKRPISSKRNRVVT